MAQGASGTSLYRALRVRSGRTVAITRQWRIYNKLESNLQPLRTRRAGKACRHAHAAVLGELERVPHQVGDDLAQA